MQTIVLLLFTLSAFAANSILCRYALKSTEISPILFTIIRLASGALILSPLILGRNKISFWRQKRSWASGFSLFSYALFFSLSYTKIPAGVGALVLFGVVQLTMLSWSKIQGVKFGTLEISGFIVAFAGLVCLLLPGLTMPPLFETLLMTISGIGWGAYTLLGQKNSQPIKATAENFSLSLPFCLLLVPYLLQSGESVSEFAAIGMDGYLTAVACGAITSAMGYVLWYLTLQRINSSLAAIVQLSVPSITALGGVIFLDETITLRLIIATLLVLLGIIFTIKGKKT